MLPTKGLIYFVVCKGPSIDDDGVSRDTIFQEIQPGATFKTAISMMKSWGGYRLERPWPL